ncbi:hypothetical protein NQZ79_g8306 [Umbelopsis isabellina]|nr:hypothetical protein NQZ79_g8306 [Umbelopsis isabellina]
MVFEYTTKEYCHNLESSVEEFPGDEAASRHHRRGKSMLTAKTCNEEKYYECVRYVLTHVPELYQFDGPNDGKLTYFKKYRNTQKAITKAVNILANGEDEKEKKERLYTGTPMACGGQQLLTVSNSTALMCISSLSPRAGSSPTPDYCAGTWTVCLANRGPANCEYSRAHGRDVRPAIAIESIMLISATLRERSRLVLWRLGWLPGKPQPCRCTTDHTSCMAHQLLHPINHHLWL